MISSVVRYVVVGCFLKAIAEGLFLGFPPQQPLRHLTRRERLIRDLMAKKGIDDYARSLYMLNQPPYTPTQYL